MPEAMNDRDRGSGISVLVARLDDDDDDDEASNIVLEESMVQLVSVSQVSF